MKNPVTPTTLALALSLPCIALVANAGVIIETQEEWTAAVESSEGVLIEDGVVTPKEKSGTLKTKLE